MVTVPGVPAELPIQVATDVVLAKQLSGIDFLTQPAEFELFRTQCAAVVTCVTRKLLIGEVQSKGTELGLNVAETVTSSRPALSRTIGRSIPFIGAVGAFTDLTRFTNTVRSCQQEVASSCTGQ